MAHVSGVWVSTDSSSSCWRVLFDPLVRPRCGVLQSLAQSIGMPNMDCTSLGCSMRSTCRSPACKSHLLPKLPGQRISSIGCTPAHVLSSRILETLSRRWMAASLTWACRSNTRIEMV